MKTIEVTDLQLWFIKCAIDLQNAVLPLEEDACSDEEFEQAWGYSKADVVSAIEDLRENLMYVQ